MKNAIRELSGNELNAVSGGFIDEPFCGTPWKPGPPQPWLIPRFEFTPIVIFVPPRG